MSSKVIKYLFGGAIALSFCVASGAFAAVTNVQSSTVASPIRSAALPSWCMDYTRNLGIGSRGNDVIALQRGLSYDGNAVSSTGYFGPLTAAAVKAFQEKHAVYVLAPLGLSRGTGYFGSSTRTMFMAWYCIPSTPTAAMTSTEGIAPVILGIAPTSSPVGGSVTITGTGFAATDTVVIDVSTMFAKSFDASSPDGRTIGFTVPGFQMPNCSPRTICPMFVIPILEGDHTLSVVANGLESNTMILFVQSGPVLN